MAVTSAIATMEITTNATWQDAFMFGDPTDTTWSFTNQSFRMDVKYTVDDTSALLTLSTANGRIVVDDPVQRILHFNVDEATIVAALPVVPGLYYYDLIMFDGSTPSVRTTLLSGKILLVKGVTGG